MKLSTEAILAILAIGQVIASGVTINLPAGFGGNGTLVVDDEQATKYLNDEAGITIERFVEYVQDKFDPPKAGVEYAFPTGSGLEKSSVTFNKDYSPVSRNQDSGDLTDCDRCWIACILLAWFPPAWGM